MSQLERNPLSKNQDRQSGIYTKRTYHAIFRYSTTVLPELNLIYEYVHKVQTAQNYNTKTEKTISNCNGSNKVWRFTHQRAVKEMNMVIHHVGL